jgi:hypothetical protein
MPRLAGGNSQGPATHSQVPELAWGGGRRVDVHTVPTGWWRPGDLPRDPTASVQGGCRHEGPRTQAEIEQERRIVRNEYGKLNDQPTRIRSDAPRGRQPWD